MEKIQLSKENKMMKETGTALSGMDKKERKDRKEIRKKKTRKD